MKTYFGMQNRFVIQPETPEPMIRNERRQACQFLLHEGAELLPKLPDPLTLEWRHDQGTSWEVVVEKRALNGSIHRNPVGTFDLKAVFEKDVKWLVEAIRRQSLILLAKKPH